MVFGKRGTSSFRPLVSVCAIWGRRERARLIASNVKRASEAEAAQGFGCFFQPVFTIRGRAEARQPSVPSVTNVWCTCFCFYSSQKKQTKKITADFSSLSFLCIIQKRSCWQNKPTIEVYCKQTCVYVLHNWVKKRKENGIANRKYLLFYILSKQIPLDSICLN